MRLFAFLSHTIFNMISVICTILYIWYHEGKKGGSPTQPFHKQYVFSPSKFQEISKNTQSLENFLSFTKTFTQNLHNKHADFQKTKYYTINKLLDIKKRNYFNKRSFSYKIWFLKTFLCSDICCIGLKLIHCLNMFISCNYTPAPCKPLPHPTQV